MTDLNKRLEELDSERNAIRSEIIKSNNEKRETRWKEEQAQLSIILDEIKKIYPKSELEFKDDGDYSDYFYHYIRIYDDNKEIIGQIETTKDGEYGIEMDEVADLPTTIKLIKFWKETINTDTNKES